MKGIRIPIAVGRVLLPALALFICPLTTLGQVDYAGTSAANFLKLPVGARAMGMAGSDLTVATDATILAWNVGMIALVPQNTVTFSHIPWLVDTQVNYLGGVYHAPFGSVGFDLRFFGAGDIEETTLAEQDGTGRFVRANSYEIGATYGKRLTDRFSFGVKLKLVEEQLANVRAGGFGMDIGAVFQTNLLRDLRLAFALTNFGSKLQFAGRDLRVAFPVPDNPEGKSVAAQLQTGEWELPLGFRIGASSDVLNSSQARLRLNYGVYDARDFLPRHLIGGELILLKILAVRTGYEIGPDDGRLTLGAGLNLDFRESKTLRVDYGFMEQPYFAGSQQLTLSVGF